MKTVIHRCGLIALVACATLSLAGCEELLGISDPTLVEGDGGVGPDGSAGGDGGTGIDGGMISCSSCGEGYSSGVPSQWCCGSDTLWNGLRNIVCADGGTACSVQCGGVCAASICSGAAPPVGGACDTCLRGNSINCGLQACLDDDSNGVCPSEICDDQMDNDGDMDVDCADSDCAGDAACMCTNPDSFEENDQFSTASPVTYTTNIAGSVCFGDADYYRFDASALNAFTCTMGIMLVTDGPVYLTVLDSSQNPLWPRTLYTMPVNLALMGMLPDGDLSDQIVVIETETSQQINYSILVAHDCGVCGDSQCALPESPTNCPADCS
jgi:hypothetical protein